MSTNAAEKLQFRPITLSDKPHYEEVLFREPERGCEFSFANLYLWGRQKICEVNGCLLLFSQFDRRSVYPYPLGLAKKSETEKKEVLDRLIADAELRGIPCRITGLSAEASATLQRLYPDRFIYHCDEGAFDYVYAIDDLADLAGKKYHAKRNHLNRFRENFPNALTEPLCEKNLPAATQMIREWYEKRLVENPHGDFYMEQAAIERALRDHKALDLEGLMLFDGERVLAVTMGSRLSHDTFDVHFEKALAEVQGAYAAINEAFAKFLREKYPEVRFLDREEDMGLEGLRRAKKSYCPHHMVEKCWAHLQEDGYDY